LGGLLVKQILRLSADSIHASEANLIQQTRGVVFMGTPNTGSDLANLAERFRIIVRPSEATKGLVSNNSHLRDLNIWYRDHAPSREIETLVFAETKLLKGVLIVDQTSADPGVRGVRPYPLDSDHLGVCKPHDRNDSLYKLTQRFIEDQLARKARPVNSVPGDGRPRTLIPNQTQSIERREDWFDLIATEFERSAALFTVSAEQTLLSDKNRLPYVGFRDLITTLSVIDQRDDKERILVWVLEDGKPELGDRETVGKIENVDTLLGRFKRLRSYFKEADTWKWLQKRAVIALHDGRSGRLGVPRLPPFGYRHLLISEPPDHWKESPNFFALYGDESERWKKATYTFFFRSQDSSGERSPSGVGDYNLRCFGHAKLPPDRKNAEVKALKLPSLDGNFSVAHGTMYAAALEMLDVRRKSAELSIDGIKIDQAYASRKLRLLGFSLLSLDQFMKR
jgi:hypothetical protein